MFFSSPLWLIALAPWALVTLWLMRRRLPPARVPFLELWETNATVAAPRRRLTVPPLSILLIIAALFLLILGMAGLSMAARGQGNPQSQVPVRIIVDRGFTMSAKGDGVPRFLKTAREAAPLLAKALGAQREIDLSFVPAYPALATDLAHWVDDLAAVPPAAIGTQDMLAGEVSRLARQGGAEPIIVISDQPLGSLSSRVIQIPPDAALLRVGISRIGARAMPQRQVFVRIHNQSEQTTATLRIESGGQSKVSEIKLPPRGESSDQFVDLAEMGDVVKASIESPAAVAGDAAAWCVRQPGRPRIETSVQLRPELERMIAVYNRTMARRESEQVRAMVVNRAEDLPPGEAAVWVDHAVDITLPEAPEIVVHPGNITAHVRWNTVLRGATLAPRPTGDGWMTLVSAEGRPAVAIRNEPARQIWVGFTSPGMAQSPDYVIFWTNVFNALGSGSGDYAWQSAGQIGAEWHAASGSQMAGRSSEPGLLAGLYRRSDGAMLAVNAPDVTAPPLPKSDWRVRLDQLAGQEAPSMALARWVDLAALMLILGAVAASAGLKSGREREGKQTSASSPERVQT